LTFKLARLGFNAARRSLRWKAEKKELLMNRRSVLQLATTFPLTFSWSFRANADAHWPAHAITMVVGLAPGGQADIAARPAAQALQDVLGQTVIVENRTGAGGAIAASYVLRSNPDGYTALMALSSAAVLPEAEKIAGRKPPYEMSDFAPVARVLADPNLLVVRADSSYKTLKDLVDDAKARLGQIGYASSGVLGGIHICMEMFCQSAEIKMLHVPYSGGAPALTGLITGDVAVTALGAAPIRGYTNAGQLRVLATFGTERHPDFPNAPTFKEAGYDGVIFYAWVGLFVPKAVPPEVIIRLREGMRTVMNKPEVIAMYKNAGSPPAYLDAPEFAAYIERDSGRILKTVQAIGNAG
jgi:tripartite-type tricarboxylate transporter receptor subunit TctC